MAIPLLFVFFREKVYEHVQFVFPFQTTNLYWSSLTGCLLFICLKSSLIRPLKITCYFIVVDIYSVSSIQFWISFEKILSVKFCTSRHKCQNKLARKISLLTTSQFLYRLRETLAIKLAPIYTRLTKWQGVGYRNVQHSEGCFLSALSIPFV